MEVTEKRSQIAMTAKVPIPKRPILTRPDFVLPRLTPFLPLPVRPMLAKASPKSWRVMPSPLSRIVMPLPSSSTLMSTLAASASKALLMNSFSAWGKLVYVPSLSRRTRSTAGSEGVRTPFA